MKVKKTDMASRVDAIVGAAPNINARFQAATAGASSHPTGARLSTADVSGAPTLPTAAPTATGNGIVHRKPRRVTAPLDLIDLIPSNARRIYRQSRVLEIARSLALHGQETAGFATFRNGRYLLAAGGYRYRGLKHNNARTMELDVWDNLTDQELYELSFRENNEREGQSALDNALTWDDLLKQEIYKNETEIAQATGFSLSMVNKTMAALKLSPELRGLVEEDPEAFKLSVLYELQLYEQAAGTQRALLIARQVMDGTTSRKQIQDARAQIVDPKARKPKEQSRQYKIDCSGVDGGVLKEWDSGKITLELEATDPAKRAQLVQQLRKMFGSAE